MKRAASAATPAELWKKADVCRALKVSGPTLEQMLEAGHLPQPIWLGPTLQSRRWHAFVIARHVASLTAKATRREPAHA